MVPRISGSFLRLRQSSCLTGWGFGICRASYEYARLFYALLERRAYSADSAPIPKYKTFTKINAFEQASADCLPAQGKNWKRFKSTQHRMVWHVQSRAVKQVHEI